MKKQEASQTEAGPRRDLYDEISSNRWKTMIIFVMFFIMIGVFGWLFGLYIGDVIVGFVMASLFCAVYCPIAYMAGDSMILTVSSARPATKQEFPFLHNTVEGLAMAAGIPMPRVFVIDDTAINAFATGRSPERAAITVTTGALKRLKRTELEGVIAHEMSHIKNFDIRVMMLAAVLVGVIALLSDFFLRGVLYGNRGNDDREGGNGAAILIVIGIVLAVLSPIIAQMIHLAVSRRREYLADASGAMLTRYPGGWLTHSSE